MSPRQSRRRRSRSRSRSMSRTAKRSPRAFVNFVRSMSQLFPNVPKAQLQKDSEALWKEMSNEDKRVYQRRAESEPPEMADPDCSWMRKKRKKKSRSRSGCGSGGKRKSRKRSKSKRKGGCR